MKPPKTETRLRHMLDHAREAVEMVKGKSRADLDRDLRDQADRKYRRLSLKEEMVEIRKSLQAKGLSHLFPEPKESKRPTKAGAKRR